MRSEADIATILLQIFVLERKVLKTILAGSRDAISPLSSASTVKLMGHTKSVTYLAIAQTFFVQYNGLGTFSRRQISGNAMHIEGYRIVQKVKL